jgi:hypothetical protein
MLDLVNEDLNPQQIEFILGSIQACLTTSCVRRRMDWFSSFDVKMAPGRDPVSWHGLRYDAFHYHLEALVKLGLLEEASSTLALKLGTYARLFRLKGEVSAPEPRGGGTW